MASVSSMRRVNSMGSRRVKDQIQKWSARVEATPPPPPPQPRSPPKQPQYQHNHQHHHHHQSNDITNNNNTSSSSHHGYRGSGGGGGDRINGNAGISPVSPPSGVSSARLRKIPLEEDRDRVENSITVSSATSSLSVGRTSTSQQQQQRYPYNRSRSYDDGGPTESRSRSNNNSLTASTTPSPSRSLSSPSASREVYESSQHSPSQLSPNQSQSQSQKSSGQGHGHSQGQGQKSSAYGSPNHQMSSAERHKQMSPGGSTTMSSGAPRVSSARAVRLVEELRGALEHVEDPYRVLRGLSPETDGFLRQWLGAGDAASNGGQPLPNSSSSSPSTSSNNNTPHSDDAIKMLQEERSELVGHLEDTRQRLDEQTDAVHELSAMLDEREHMLKQELLSKTNLETHKLDLMAEISNLKLRLATSDKDRLELREKLNHATSRIDDLQSRLNDRTIEVTELRTRLAKNGTLPSSLDRSASFNDRTLEREKTLDRLKRKHTEIEQLKKAVESLVISNDEKEQHIGELQRLIKRHKRVEEILLSAAGKKGLELDFDIHSDTSSQTQHSAGSSGGADQQQQHDHVDGQNGHELRPQLPPMPTPSATSTPVKFSPAGGENRSATLPSTPPSSFSSTSPIRSHNDSTQRTPQRSSSVEDMSPKTPPTVKRRTNGSSNGSGAPGFAQPNAKGWYSEDDDAQTETDEEALKDEMAQQYKQLQNQQPTEERHRPKQKKGIKRFFGKLRRSNSQDLEPDFGGEFKRGGVRSTAGARLGWSKDLNNDGDIPFARWDSDRVALWLHNLGLSMYVGECRRWLKNGEHLMKASQHDMEKELGMRNAMHRKKLTLALAAYSSPTADPAAAAARLDHNWVTRWLDDIGLPQYKDHFIEARVDGRMLHCLTVEDLVSLKVTNTLHHLSIKRAIQVLRLNSFNPICLKRRPSPDEGSIHDAPSEVLLWTNHRVMEWLRSIDFSEYAPNLRGSGVHGGIVVLEPRFTAELFAGILSIPPGKTLLRRHLSTHFVSLIGNNTQQKKREHEQQPGHTPLTPNQKVKLRKKLFGHKRNNSETDDLLCPLNNSDTPLSTPSVSRENSQNGRPGHTRNGSLPRTELARKNSATSNESNDIGSYSFEIKTLTNMLARDQFLDNVPTSNV